MSGMSNPRSTFDSIEHPCRTGAYNAFCIRLCAMRLAKVFLFQILLEDTHTPLVTLRSVVVQIELIEGCSLKHIAGS